MLRLHAFFIFFLITVIAGCSKSSQAGSGAPPVSVEATVAKLVNWQQQMNATGTLTALQGATLKAETMGRVTSIAFKPGTEVAAGTLLVQINPDVLRAQLEAAQASLKLNRANYERAKQLYQRKVIAKANLDDALSSLQAAQAAVHQYQAQLDQTMVRAPFKGQAGLNQVEVGDYVNVGQPIVSLQTIDPLRIDFSVPETTVGQIAVGQTVLIHATAYPQQTFKGTITALDSSIAQTTRSLAVRASIPNPAKLLLPGGFANITILLGQPQAVIFIPKTAVVATDSENYVYRVINNKAVKSIIQPGETIGDNTIVLKGLKAGEQIVSVGQFKLVDNAPIVIMGASLAQSGLTK